MTKEKITRFVKFGLYRDGQLVEEKESDTGSVTFEKLIADVEYEVKELEAPLGYIKSEEVLKVTLKDEDKELTFEYENEPVQEEYKPVVETSDTTQNIHYGVALLISLIGLCLLRKNKQQG